MSLPGKLLYKFYYGPKSRRAVKRKFGGQRSYQEMLAAEAEMKKFALESLIIDNGFGPDAGFKLNFLTGDRFIHQSLFCVYSFFKFLTSEESQRFSVNFYSDGTLSPVMAGIVKSRFPQIELISFEKTQAALRAYLPVSRFPRLNEKTATVPLFKKMIYPHLGRTGGAAFLDSDMLFMKRPDTFLDWVEKFKDSPRTSFCILDVNRSYGYSEEDILKICPGGILNNINSGMYGIDSGKVDFDFIERLVGEFEVNFGSQYYLEQMLTAIILEQSPELVVADPGEYIVLPDDEQVRGQTGTLHHYVNESKLLYFKESWRKQIRS